MPKYLTVNQVRSPFFYFGLDLSSFSDPQLAQFITMAESDVDSYMGFDVKRGGFEPHHVWVQEPFDMETRKTSLDFLIPVRTILNYSIQMSTVTASGAPFSAIIKANDIAINNYSYYLEIVPLTAVSFTLYPTMFGMGLKPPLVLAELSLGHYLLNSETLQNFGDNLTYYSLRAFWATSVSLAPGLTPIDPSLQPSASPTILVNGATPVPSYTVDPVNGLVTFASMLQDTDVVTVSCSYQIPDEVRDAARIQTFYYIRQALLNRMGLFPEVYRIRSGDQEIMGQMAKNLAGTMVGPLVAEAASKLKMFERIGIA